MRDYQKELSDYMQTKKEETKLPESAQTIFEDIANYHISKKRSKALREAINTLKQEELLIDENYTRRLDELEEEVIQFIQTIEKHISSLLTELTPKQWFTLLALIEKNQTKEQLHILVESFTETHKEQFYHAIRTLPHTQEERVLLHRFEERLAYSYAFLHSVQPKEKDEALLPFEQFFETYVPVYHQKIAATLRWLKKDVFSMHLNEALLERYAESTVRRLEIGEHIEDVNEKQQYIKTVVLELKELLRVQQQKKSSK